jgi:MraZ protein
VALIGRYYHALEQKGRLSIPKSYRDELGSPVIITRGLDGCLFCFAKSKWQQVEADLASLSLNRKQARDYIRLIAQSAYEVPTDGLGRILIPESLRNLAALKKRVVVAGSISRLEIWDESTYHTYLDKLANEAELISEGISQP